MSVRKAPGLFPLIPAALFLVLMLLNADAAAESARNGLQICLGLIIPSLFPLFVMSALVTALGLPHWLSRFLGPAAARLFHVSGAAATAFLAGITGGYPLGAAALGDLCRSGSISREEAEYALPFCNNCGPAFIIGAAGTGIFGSSTAGFLLWGAQITAALLTGMLLAPQSAYPCTEPPASTVYDFAPALTEALKKALASTLSICGYVLFFTVFSGVLDSLGFFHMLCRLLVPRTGLPMQTLRALFMGFLELGSGISALRGLPCTPLNAAICAFILGWGGLSVHFQTLGVLEGTNIKTARHGAGRLLCGILSAALSAVLFSIFGF